MTSNKASFTQRKSVVLPTLPWNFLIVTDQGFSTSIMKIKGNKSPMVQSMDYDDPFSAAFALIELASLSPPPLLILVENKVLRKAILNLVKSPWVSRFDARLVTPLLNSLSFRWLMFVMRRPNSGSSNEASREISHRP